jgi:hypothetical protein
MPVVEDAGNERPGSTGMVRIGVVDERVVIADRWIDARQVLVMPPPWMPRRGRLLTKVDRPVLERMLNRKRRMPLAYHQQTG